MDLHVAAEISSVIEVLAAHGAGRCEFPGPSVNGHVVLEVAQLGERLAALAAGIPRGYRVTPHVDCERIATREHLEYVHI